jgi:UDP-glucose 4-epimerase
VLAELLDARRVPTRGRVLRAAADVTWRLHLQPTPAGWVDLALGVPIMDSSRARTPPLATRSGGPLRARELLTGVGNR